MLNRQQFFIKEHTGMFKTANSYDILDPESQEKIGLAQEKPSFLRIFLKEKAPTRLEVTDSEGNAVLTINRPMALIGRPKIRVTDAGGKDLGYFLSKILSIGGGFTVYDMENKKIADVKGNWKGRDFRMLGDGDKELGKVTQQFAGMAKEMFTSADNYVVVINEEMASDVSAKTLLLAAALTIDMVMNE